MFWRIFLAMMATALLVACGSSESGDDDDDVAPVNDDLDNDFDHNTDDDADDDVDDADDDVDDDLNDDVDDDTDDDVDDDADDDVDPIPTTIAGQVFRFDWTFDHLEGATVDIFERPDLPAVATDADGAFAFEDAFTGEDNSLVTRHRDFWPTQTATVVPDENGIDDMAVQIPPRLIVRLLSLALWEPLRSDRCQIATTVTEADATPFSPGLAGAAVSIDPPLPAESGPFYFEIIEIPGWPMIDIPRRDLTETTADGGAVFINVPEGEYTLGASRGDDVFTTARVKCRAGFLVNAAPPYGLSITSRKK